MKHLTYSHHVLAVADETGQCVLEIAVEFGTAGQVVAVPVACYLEDRDTTLTVLSGAGLPVTLGDPPVVDARPDPALTAMTCSWIRDELKMFWEVEADAQ